MVITNIDWNQPGKQQSFLRVPYSHNLGGWANVMIPITTVAPEHGRTKTGPTVLLLGGNHGDEYQGQIAAMRLARELTPSMVNSRIIIIPSLNFPAARAATRLSPLDGMNMNRAFPGDANGTVTSQIAHYLTHTLFPFLYTDIAGNGLLPVEAENQGKTVVTTELGGGEAIPAHIHRIAQSGLRNVLIHLGLLEGKEQTRESLGKPPTILTQALSVDDYLLAPESGIFEICHELGSPIRRGDTIGFIHHLERPDRAPEKIVALTEGYLMTMRAPCLTQQGDCVAVIAQAVDPITLA
jgi:N-alpha-acetyl-L-2,4-diaminobutyrate deacetylase